VADYDDVLTLAKIRNITSTTCEVNIIRKYHVASRAIAFSIPGSGILVTLDRTTRKTMTEKARTSEE